VVGLAALLLALASPAQNLPDKPTVELNGGMTAQLLSLSRDPNGRDITAAVKVTNTGTNHVSLMISGTPSAVDDAGVSFLAGTVSGVGWCRNRTAQCIGTTYVETAFPLQQYTEIDPGTSVTAFFRLPVPSGGASSKRLSLSAEMAYRIVNDPTTDADLSTRKKLEQVHMGNLGFDPVTITESAGGNQRAAGGNPLSSPALVERPAMPDTGAYGAPAPSSPAARSMPSDGADSGVAGSVGHGITSVVNDDNLSKIRLIWFWYAFLVGLPLLLLLVAIKEYRTTREANAFAPFLLVTMLGCGAWLWFDYFAGHGALFAWPLVVVMVLLVLFYWRKTAVERHKREYAESLKYVDKTPIYGDAREASPDDERWAGL
jgi:hypothetical protein